MLRNCFIQRRRGDREAHGVHYLGGLRRPPALACCRATVSFSSSSTDASGITDWTASALTHPGVISLPFPAGVTITRVADWDLFNGAVLHRAWPAPTGVITTITIRSWSPMRWRPLRRSAHSVRKCTASMADCCASRRSTIRPTGRRPSGTTNDGSGYIDLSAQDADSTNLIGLEVYLGNMAIFSTPVDPDLEARPRPFAQSVRPAPALDRPARQPGARAVRPGRALCVVAWRAVAEGAERFADRRHHRHRHADRRDLSAS